jgi:pyruvate kinase
MAGGAAPHPRRRTRIVATLGPATDPPGVLEQMVEAGLDVVRVNYSHGSVGEAAERITRCRRIARELSRPLAVLADLPGPKLRVLLPAPLLLRPGQEVAVGLIPGPADFHVTEPEIFAELETGDRVLLDDGRLRLRAQRADATRVVLRVEVGGTLQPDKGVNLPDTRLTIPALTARDHAALAAAAAAGIDWLALSFVRSPADASELRDAARGHGLEVPVLAKIERPEAVERADEIVEAFDGVMVARGDLGVEIPLEQVPQVQKRLITLARRAAKPVVTATDMLDSMRTNLRPTRAEVNDVAGAVYDGTDALMLSGETAVGQHPVTAVAWMDRIARETDASFGRADRDVAVKDASIRDHLTRFACALAREMRVDAILAPTVSGRTARLVARHRPGIPIIALSSEAVLRQLALVWGVHRVPLDLRSRPGEDDPALVVRAAFLQGAIMAGDHVVLLADRAVEGGERVPTIRVIRVGEAGQSCEP